MLHPVAFMVLLLFVAACAGALGLIIGMCEGIERQRRLAALAQQARQGNAAPKAGQEPSGCVNGQG